MTDEELTESVYQDFNQFKDVTFLLASYVKRASTFEKEFKITNLIPSDHEYWIIRSKIFRTQELFNQKMLPEPEVPLDPLQSYRMLKYGRAHKFNRKNK